MITGIMGGTFDPVHFGHLRPGLEILQALELDELRLIPCHIPPHRPRPHANPSQRLMMLQEAVRHEPRLIVDSRELERDGASYTYDTLLSFREELGDIPLCLIIGMDAFLQLPEWHRWQDLLDLCHVVAMLRPGRTVPVEGVMGRIARERLVSDRQDLCRKSSGYILYQEVTQMDISATAIRDMLLHGKSPRFLLPDAVLTIIEAEGIYQ